MTLLAFGHAMHFKVIRRFDGPQGVAHMAGLPTTRFATACAQTLRARFPEAIAGGRLATVATVLGDLVFQDLTRVSN